ncbi:MAG: hypothetical protein WCF94_00635 [bacterium]
MKTSEKLSLIIVTILCLIFLLWCRHYEKKHFGKEVPIENQTSKG